MRIEPISPTEDPTDDVLIPHCISKVEKGRICVPLMNNHFNSVELPTDRCIMRVRKFSLTITETEEVVPRHHYEKDPVVAAEKRQMLLERLEHLAKKGEPVPFIPGVNMDEADLDEHQKRLLTYILASARGVFAVDDTDLGCTDLVKHKIDTSKTSR